MAVRRGVRLGVDVGTVRVGVARSDPDGMLATPIETVARGQTDLDRLAELVAEYDAIEVIVGLPRSLSGRDSHAATAARDYARELARVLRGRGITAPVRLVDERMSTVSAEQAMRAAGMTRRKQRAVVDQAAAVVILQHAMESERATGVAPGEPVED
jgi:putative holliday junction resolvase